MGNLASIGILFVALLIAPVSPAKADYAQMTLFQLLTRAEIVVSGTVQEVSDDTYELDVVQAFRNAGSQDILTVERVDLLRLGDRWADYARGQQVVLFAQVSDTESATVAPLGAAGEGELPVVAQMVHPTALSRPPADMTRATYLGGSRAYYRVEADTFQDAIAGFFDCYRPTDRGRIARLCDDLALQDYRQLSWLAAHISGIADRLPEGEN